MKFLFASVAVLLLVIQMTAALNDVFVQHLWNKFKKSHGKTFLSDEHELQRFTNFKRNVDIIEKHNSEYSMGMYTYTLGINQFADWTVEEFKSKMLGSRFNMTQFKEGNVATFMRLPQWMQVPDSVDWREQGIVTKVKNQGECGSCWAFSTTGSLEGAHARATGNLVSLSEQQLVDCSKKYGNEGCNGGLMDNAFTYIKENGGVDTEESYPYHAREGKCKFSKDTIGATCTGYADVPSEKEDALKEALATVGPVSVAIDATEEKFMLYKEGILVDNTCGNGTDTLNHGVLAVGYGTNSTSGGKTLDYWIVKNSWGPSWGEAGYIRMARNKGNMCGIASAASYPLVK